MKSLFIALLHELKFFWEHFYWWVHLWNELHQVSIWRFELIDLRLVMIIWSYRRNLNLRRFTILSSFLLVRIRRIIRIYWSLISFRTCALLLWSFWFLICFIRMINLHNSNFMGVFSFSSRMINWNWWPHCLIFLNLKIVYLLSNFGHCLVDYLWEWVSKWH